MTPHALETKAVVSVFVCLCVWCRAQSWTINHRQRRDGGRRECLSHRGPQLWAGFWNIQPLLLSAIVFVVIGDLSICFPALDLPNGACVSHALKQHDQSVHQNTTSTVCSLDAEMWMIIVSIRHVIITHNVFAFSYEREATDVGIRCYC